MWQNIKKTTRSCCNDSLSIPIPIIVHVVVAHKSVKKMTRKISLNSSPEPLFQPVGPCSVRLYPSTLLISIYIYIVNLLSLCHASKLHRVDLLLIIDPVWSMPQRVMYPPSPNFGTHSIWLSICALLLWHKLEFPITVYMFPNFLSFPISRMHANNYLISNFRVSNT